MEPMRVLFVCKANIGRSQALRVFTQRFLEAYPNLAKRIQVDSAGTDPGIVEDVKRQPSITLGLKELYEKTFGITHDMATRKPIDRELLGRNDLVLVAEPGLKRSLHEIFPDYAHKIITVKEYLWPKLSDRRQVIDDPPHPTTRRYGKRGKTRIVDMSKRKKNYKMLRECKGVSKRLVERWNRLLTQRE